MRTLAPGNDVTPTFGTFVPSLPPEGANFFRGGPSKNFTIQKRTAFGFTLLELLLVVAIIAVASAGVSFALRDSGQTVLEREAQRLAALLESARARSMATGVPVRWQVTATGFVFEGLAPGSLPDAWLSPDVAAVGPAALPAALLLGPEPIIGPQAVRLVLIKQRDQSLTVMTDGVRPFSVVALP